MNKQSLIIFNIPVLFNILNELKETINFDIFDLRKINDLNHMNESNYGNYLIITKSKIPDHLNTKSIYLEDNPPKFCDLIEKINLKFLKNKFVNQSHFKVKKFLLDLNSRIISYKNKTLKLTEREIDIILYLNNSKQSETVENLQKEVWGHGATLETHTVETHIYRLRKKINDAFGEISFIISTDNGYKLV